MGQYEKTAKPHRPAITEEQLHQIQKQAETIRYGTIGLIFQDGVLVQIDRCEKIRV